MMPGTGAGDVTSRAARDGLVELCAFRVGDEEYVIDLRRIREILVLGPITSVPRAPDCIEGVMTVRGEVIAVVDVRKRLRVSPRDGNRAKVLVVNIADKVLGLIVDGVIEVVRTTRSGIGPPPLLPDGPRLFLGVCGAREPRAGAGTSGIVRQPRRLRLLLNVKALLEPDAPASAAASRLSAAATIEASAG